MNIEEVSTKIRIKFYSKTLEEITSWGVNYDKTCETFNRMVVTKNTVSKDKSKTNPKEIKEIRQFNEKRKLTSTDGKVKERLEVSFYSDELKTFETYVAIIKNIIPEDPNWYYDIKF